MPRPIFSWAAPVEVGVSFLPVPRTQRPGCCKPGQRIIEGRVFYSAAWLDRAASTPSEPPALKRRGDDGLEHHAVEAGVAPASVPGLGV